MSRTTFILIFSLLSSAVISQVELNLEDCLKLAHDNNLSLKGSALSVEMAKIGLSESKQGRLPNLNAQLGASYFAGRGIDPTTNDFITETFLSNDLSLSSGFTLYNGGRINNQIKQDALGLGVAEANRAQIFNDISLSVVLSYLNVLAGQETVENARAQLEISREQKRDLQRFIELGSRAANDILDLEVQELNDEQNLITAENQLQLDLLTLKQAIRWEGEQDIRVAPPPEDLFDGLTMDGYSVDQLYQAALSSLPGVRASELALKQSEMGLKVAKSGFYPSLSANLFLNTRYSDAAKDFNSSLEWTPLPLRLDGQQVNVEIQQPVITAGETTPLSTQWDENLGYGVGLSLAIPIYNRGLVKSNTQRAKIGIEQSELDLENTRDQVRRDVENAYTNALNSRKAYQAATRSMQATEAAYENSRKRYGVGNATNLELSSAKTLFENAQRLWTTSKYTYLLNVKVLDYYLGKKLTF